MKVLILGGTGAMGIPLQKYLLKLGYEVHVTSRSRHKSGDVVYIQGNAHDTNFLPEILKENFDVVVDFMSYKTEEFLGRVKSLLTSTAQYIFISSSRVYAPSNTLITEDSPQLLNVCGDPEYLKTDEYALSKARQENALRYSGRKNWTIIRPSLTYNSERLQYAIGEKEDWLYRYLHNEKIVFPTNMGQVMTTMSYGDDVAYAISLLVGNSKALGEAIHIAGARTVTWNEINDIYRKVLVENFHREPEIVFIDNWEDLGRALGRYYQLKYARSISRSFDNSKLESLIGKIDFADPEAGLTYCLKEFLEGEQIFKSIFWKAEAYFNRISMDKGIANTFSGKEKIKYMIGRYTPYLDWKA